MHRRLMPDWWYDEMSLRDRREATIAFAAFLIMLGLSVLVGGPSETELLETVR